jgi:transposase InsO family protein
MPQVSHIAPILFNPRLEHILSESGNTPQTSRPSKPKDRRDEMDNENQQIVHTPSYRRRKRQHFGLIWNSPGTPRPQELATEQRKFHVCFSANFLPE